MTQNKEVIKYEEMQKTFEKNREVYSIEDLRDICSSTLSSLIHQINGSTTGFNLLVEIFQENEKKKLTNVEYNRKAESCHSGPYREDFEIRVDIILKNRIYPVSMSLTPKDITVFHENMDDNEVVVSIPEKGLLIKPSDIVRIVPVEEVNRG